MGFFDGPNPQSIDNWVCILERGTEYEVILTKNWLTDRNIPSNILSKRDSSYNLNIGETSMVYLYVPIQFEKAAREALRELDEAEVEFEDDDPDEAGVDFDDDPDESSRSDDPGNHESPPDEDSPGEERR